MSLRLYLIGFAVSLLATLGAYALVAQHLLPFAGLIVAVVALAVIQCVVQGICFLHLSFKGQGKLQLAVTGFALIVITIVVSGSLWIMFHLNERMMSNPALMEQYMQDQDGF